MKDQGAAIELTGLRKVYRIGDERVVALDHIDLSIPKGQICCLLGPSGSGKSTLLNMIAGLERPTKGSIVIHGTPIQTLSERRLVLFRQKRLGFIFQAYNLLPSLTALENVALPLMFAGAGRRARNAKAMELLDLVGLKKYVKHKPTQMSGGQQQRVGIARAFATDAKIILADEPTGNLDSKTTAQVMRLMIDVVRKNKQTLILVTHDLSIAAYADRVVHILDGLVSSDELNASPPPEASEALPDNIPAAPSEVSLDGQQFPEQVKIPDKSEVTP